MGEVTLENIKALLQAQSEELKVSFKSSFDAVNIHLHKHSKKIHQLENRCVQLERKIRKNNIVIFGLKVNQESLAEDTIQQLNNLLDLRLNIGDINNVYRVSKNLKSPILVEFLTYHKKLEVYKNKDKLRSLKEVNVGIANDLCLEDRRDQKILRKTLRLCREKSIPARIKGNKIEIDGKWYSPQELEEADSSGSDGESEEMEDQPSLSEAIPKKATKTVRRGKGKKGVGVGVKHLRGYLKKKRKVQTPSPTISERITRNYKKTKTGED